MVSTVLDIVKGGFLFSRFGFVFPADHGIFAHGLQQLSKYTEKLLFPQRQAAARLLFFLQMLVERSLQLLVDGGAQLADVPVRLPSQHCQFGGAI